LDDFSASVAVAIRLGQAIESGNRRDETRPKRIFQRLAAFQFPHAGSGVDGHCGIAVEDPDGTGAVLI
jgi:hypothetical protein